MNKGGKHIAKNTVILYLRMMVTMLVTLYTSRIILESLGIEDYGIYGCRRSCHIIFIYKWCNDKCNSEIYNFCHRERRCNRTS